MDTNPQGIASMSFKLVKRGYDIDEVRAYLADVARQLETAQNQATAMEARARAALAKLQELQQQQTTQGEAGPSIAPDEAEAISRTLLLAQRTADSTVSGAKAEAESILTKANTEAGGMLDASRAQAARLIDEARVEARRTSEAERLRAEGEVQALLARREFLLSDVEHLEEFIAAQRRRLVQTADLLQDIAARPESGLGDVRRPLLSAAGDASGAAALAAEMPSSATPPVTSIGVGEIPESPLPRRPVVAGAEPAATTGTAGSWASSLEDTQPTEAVAPAAPAQDDTLVMSRPEMVEEIDEVVDDPTPVEGPAAVDFDDLTAEFGTSTSAPEGLRIVGDDGR